MNKYEPLINYLSEYITVKGIMDEDFVNYKFPSMTILFPHCSFKCEKDGSNFCHNSTLVNEKDIRVLIKDLYCRYINNPITHAIVCQGLEPFDSWEELNGLLFHFRIHQECLDPIVIYTGYNKDEISDQIEFIKKMYSNIIIKFGRYIPNQEKHYDDVLGVYLASDNQYAEKIT